MIKLINYHKTIKRKINNNKIQTCRKTFVISSSLSIDDEEIDAFIEIVDSCVPSDTLYPSHTRSLTVSQAVLNAVNAS